MRLGLLLHSEEKETTFIHCFFTVRRKRNHFYPRLCTHGSLACRIPLRADASVPECPCKAFAQNRDFDTNKMYKRNLKSSISFKTNLTAWDHPQLPPCWFHGPSRELRSSVPAGAALFLALASFSPSSSSVCGGGTISPSTAQ